MTLVIEIWEHLIRWQWLSRKLCTAQCTVCSQIKLEKQNQGFNFCSRSKRITFSIGMNYHINGVHSESLIKCNSFWRNWKSTKLIVLTLSKLGEAFRVHPQLVGLSFAAIAPEQSIHYQDKVHTRIKTWRPSISYHQTLMLTFTRMAYTSCELDRIFTKHV